MFEEKVKAGVNWLNQNHKGWYNKIDIEVLHMFSNYNCILGQLYGSYSEGIKLFDTFDSILDYGFTMLRSEAENTENWEHLKSQWKKEILQLRELETGTAIRFLPDTGLIILS